MADNSLLKLQDSLKDGLSIVSRIWDQPTKSWVTCIYAEDIDDDGENEVVVCTREGRVYLLSSDGTIVWQRIIGVKAWVGTAIVSKHPQSKQAQIIVGTRDGRIYILDRYGRTISKENKTFAFDETGRAINPQEEQRAYWFSTGYAIRQVCVNPSATEIIFASEDRSVYKIDYSTGELIWEYKTNGWVRAVYVGDITGDGKAEVLIGSADRHLYLFDDQNELLVKYPIGYQVLTLAAADTNQDGRTEVLIATNSKDLIALNYVNNGTPSFQPKWQRSFENRFYTLCITDLEGDGPVEIIAGSEDKHIYILDGQGNTVWRHNHKNRIYTIYPSDIDNDGLPELLIGSEQERVRAMRVRLRRGIEKRILRYYLQQNKVNPSALHILRPDERALLQDILGPEREEQVTLERATREMEMGAYQEALLNFLKLEQQKVEQIWHKMIPGHIRAVCLRLTQNKQKREIIVVTSDGQIYAFGSNKRRLWHKELQDQIIDVQTGFVDKRMQEEIIICSSNHYVYILGEKERSKEIEDTLMSSICVLAPSVQSPPEIIIGSEGKKLYIYRGGLDTAPYTTIATEEAIRLVRAHPPTGDDMPEIVAASMGRTCYAYTRSGKYLWSYNTHDYIRAVSIKDINNDGKVEVLIGSEDRNIHVLDCNGQLIWRYYLPHHVRTIDAFDMDQDGKVEIFVGCADGSLYVFDRRGDLRWTYQSSDRIQTIRVEDLDNDGNIEILLGTEESFEVLRVLDQQQISSSINQCWQAFYQGHSELRVILSILNAGNTHPLLQSFALKKLIERYSGASEHFDLLARLAKEGTIEVRQTLARSITQLYQCDSTKARTLLYQLSTNTDPEVRAAVITAILENLSSLMSYDWEYGFSYLQRAVENESTDRTTRRMMVRQLHQLIDTVTERPAESYRGIFGLLLTAAHYKESEWVRQEAARTLAHFLDQHQGKLIIYMHLLIVKNIPQPIWERIEHISKTPVVKRYTQAVIALLFHANRQNMLANLQHMMIALNSAADLRYGEDIRKIYAELVQLLSLQSVEEVANYQCQLQVKHFNKRNQFAPIILEAFELLGQISRPLKLYFLRTSFHDRLAALLESQEALEKTRRDIDKLYDQRLLEESISRLPDHQVFLILLEQWRDLIQIQLNELRGNAEIKAELQTRELPFEEQVVIWLNVKNTGSSSATDLTSSLLHNSHFKVTEKSSSPIDVLSPGEERTVEFTLAPCYKNLNLQFEIAYLDADKQMKVRTFEACLELEERPQQQEFHIIPNRYSSGLPTHDSKMFYGREKDMKFLIDNLTRDAKVAIILYGQRRTGKTTMLVQFMKSPELDGQIPVLIDLQRVSYNVTIENFLRRVAYSIERAMKQKDLVLTTPADEDLAEDPTYAFDIFLDQVEEQLGNHKLILMIDEFEVLEEQVVKGNLKSEIFEFLRNMVQHRQKINFLLSGTHQITDYTKWYRSVFFHIAQHYRLSQLTAQGAEDLIQMPVEGFLSYEPLSIKKIHQLTDDQPYLVHLICKAIVDHCNEHAKSFVTINDVNSVLHEVMQTGQFHFDWIWDQIKPEERVALAAVAEGGQEEGRWLSFSEIEEIYRRSHISSEREYLLDALKKLIELDVLETEPTPRRKTALSAQRFRIPVGLTRRWLLEEHPLNVVRKEMHH